MTISELEQLPRIEAFALVTRLLAGVNFSETEISDLSSEQQIAYGWIEALYYDGEITYGELWRLCGKPLTNAGSSLR